MGVYLVSDLFHWQNAQCCLRLPLGATLGFMVSQGSTLRWCLAVEWAVLQLWLSETLHFWSLFLEQQFSYTNKYLSVPVNNQLFFLLSVCSWLVHESFLLELLMSKNYRGPVWQLQCTPGFYFLECDQLHNNLTLGFVHCLLILPFSLHSWGVFLQQTTGYYVMIS